jgi:methionyl-tRNA formyltransferase
VIFWGTPLFAAPVLKALLLAGENVVAVVTQPDKPSGRGQKLSHGPVKEIARAHDLPVLQPVRLKDPAFTGTLRELAPEIMAVAAYGRILTPEILALPAIGCLNVHASLLPQYRGAAPITWALIRGERETGVTIMWMEYELDSGPIFLQDKVTIQEDDDAGTLSVKLAEGGASLLVEALELLRQGKAVRKAQPEEGISYAPPISPQMRRLNWQQAAPDVSGWIRGLSPKPGAFTTFKGERLKLFGARVRTERGSLGPPGAVLGLCSEGVEIACGQGSIIVKELQLAGSKRHPAADFWRGHPMDKEVLG